MKYITCKVHTSVVSGDIRVKHVYLESIEPYSMVMTHDKTDAMIFDTEEEIKPSIIFAKDNQYDTYDSRDYEDDNWIVESVTEKEIFVRRLK